MAVTPVTTPSPNVGTHGYVTIVDVQGYPIGTIASSDGAAFGSISGESQFVYNSGGPALADGTPSQFAFDRERGYLGKGSSNALTITTTVSGDTTLIFPTAPKSLMPGQAIRLHNVSIGDEYVCVADSPTFEPSATATTIPLKWPIVHSGLTDASWDIFNEYGPNGGTFTPVGVGLKCLALPTGDHDNLTVAASASADNILPQTVLETMLGLFDGVNAQRQRGPSVFKPFNAQAVSAAASNTPTLIWTPASGKKFRLMGYWFSTSNAAGLLFHDLVATGGTGLLAIPSPVHAAGAVIQSPPLGNGVLSGVANNKLWIDATAATTLTGFVFGTEEL